VQGQPAHERESEAAEIMRESGEQRDRVHDLGSEIE
jgi:hypothetical protein